MKNSQFLKDDNKPRNLLRNWATWTEKRGLRHSKFIIYQRNVQSYVEFGQDGLKNEQTLKSYRNLAKA